MKTEGKEEPPPIKKGASGNLCGGSLTFEKKPREVLGQILLMRHAQWPWGWMGGKDLFEEEKSEPTVQGRNTTSSSRNMGVEYREGKDAPIVEKNKGITGKAMSELYETV